MVVVFDIGATHTRVALAKQDVLAEVVRFDTDPSAMGFGRFMGILAELTHGSEVTAVVGGMAGQLEGEDGHLTLTPNLPQWQGVAVRRQMKQLFECPVYILNDVMMGGLGECHHGAGSTQGVMVYMTVSTGVNAVRIVDGRVDESIVRYEIGQHLIEERHGHVASLESLAGGAALERRYRRKPREIRNPAVWEAEERHLAVGLYNLILDWTPDLVVLGGSMMRDVNVRHLARDLARFPHVLSSWPRLRRAKLKDTAGLLGAVEYLRQMTQKS